jgi:hypothetical protein
LLVRDCKLLLRKRLADSGGEALHQQALKRLQRFWSFFMPLHFCASTSAGIKKALMLCIKAFLL